jgi:hypothetical protein
VSTLEWQLSLRDADQQRVEQTVGWPLFTHMRGLAAVAAYRRRSLDRAYDLYEEAVAAAAVETDVSARGLLVLQRTALAVEDLGGLLHALRAPDPFLALTSTRIDEIDAVFVDLFDRRADAATLFRLPSVAVIEREQRLDDVTRRAYLRLRAITVAAVERDLALVGIFWMSHCAVAKRTLHGFGLVASAHVLGPPPAGELAQFVPAGQARPFALSLITTRDDRARHLNTEYQVVELTPPMVELVARSGRAAIELIELLRDGWLFAMKTGGFALPTKHAEQLPADERAALREVASEA